MKSTLSAASKHTTAPVTMTLEKAAKRCSPLLMSTVPNSAVVMRAPSRVAVLLIPEAVAVCGPSTDVRTNVVSGATALLMSIDKSRIAGKTSSQ